MGSCVGPVEWTEDLCVGVMLRCVGPVEWTEDCVWGHVKMCWASRMD